MAKGNLVVVKSEAGRNDEGTISGTGLKPGIVVQLKSLTSPVLGQPTWEAYDRSASGDRPKGPLAILDIDLLGGKTRDDAYNDGDRCFVWYPTFGDELNMLVKDFPGTGSASDVDIGDIMMPEDGTGKLVLQTGSPQTGPFVVKEAVADLTADTHVHVQFTGY